MQSDEVSPAQQIVEWNHLDWVGIEKLLRDRRAIVAENVHAKAGGTPDNRFSAVSDTDHDERQELAFAQALRHLRDDYFTIGGIQFASVPVDHRHRVRRRNQHAILHDARASARNRGNNGSRARRSSTALRSATVSTARVRESVSTIRTGQPFSSRRSMSI